MHCGSFTTRIRLVIIAIPILSSNGRRPGSQKHVPSTIVPVQLPEQNSCTLSLFFACSINRALYGF